jgi:hypothetical protein
LAVLAAIGVSRGALAANPTVALADGNSLTTASGLTYTISSCIYVLSGVSQSSCGTDNAVLEASGTGRSAVMEVLSATPGGSVLSLSGASATISDLTFDLALTSTSPSLTLTSFTDTMAASGSTALPTEVSTGVSSGSTTANFNLTTSLASLSDSASFNAFNTATAPINLNVDLKVTTIPGNTGAISLNSVTYSAPEPASIALFGTALTGLVAIRRRSKRPARQKSVAV